LAAVTERDRTTRWLVRDLGQPADVMDLVDERPRDPAAGEVVVKVEAVSLNFPDLLLCQGKYQDRPRLPFTPGLELAGTVVAAGKRWRAGDQVVALPDLPEGGLASHVTLPERNLYRSPPGAEPEEAATLLITYQTAYLALHRRARLRKGETVLIHGAAGGVGSAAVQIALAAGAKVIAVAGGPSKAAICRRLGADIVIDHSSTEVAEAVKDATQGKGADVILDPVGGDVFDASRRCIAWEGRIVIIGFTGGRIAELPTNHPLLKNYSVIGLFWGRYRSVDPRVLNSAHEDIVRLYAAGAVKPLISARYRYSEAPLAIASLSDRTTYGKVVVMPAAG